MKKKCVCGHPMTTRKLFPNHLVCIYCGRTESMTNADRIRSMSDEELAASVYIPCPYDDGGWGECKYGWHDREQTCEECKLEWLRLQEEVK